MSIYEETSGTKLARIDRGIFSAILPIHIGSMQTLNAKHQSRDVRGNSDLTGLTSKQHLFARVLLVVALANTVIFYVLLRKSQLVTWQFAFAVTTMTLISLTLNLEFWWKYQRK
ncbi:MAG TPA: hypothetical protein VEH56_07670 [Candidatus Saccharimonadales bacterium]|nr:hypothetical protein [Candidatus Saccharimonadales bacterium]